jgi:hypothetical protein
MLRYFRLKNGDFDRKNSFFKKSGDSVFLRKTADLFSAENWRKSTKNWDRNVDPLRAVGSCAYFLGRTTLARCPAAASGQTAAA